MGSVQATVLALVQGFTEFLPISSSAHLILTPWLLGWEDQGLVFDVVVHLGTLTAVCIYFRRDIGAIIIAMWHSVRGGKRVAEARLGWFIGLATIPVGLAGLLMKDWVSHAGRSPQLIGIASIAFGLLLWWADHTGKRVREGDTLGLKDALFIGCAQAVALIPGTSRSGITMTAGLMLGLTRKAAARFSFLLSIPVIVLSGGLGVVELVSEGPDLTRITPLLIGFVVSALSAYLCIALLLKWLERHTMGVFVAYRVALGAAILLLA